VLWDGCGIFHELTRLEHDRFRSRVQVVHGDLIWAVGRVFVTIHGRCRLVLARLVNGWILGVAVRCPFVRKKDRRDELNDF
jgi:hypothetical protein